MMGEQAKKQTEREINETAGCKLPGARPNEQPPYELSNEQGG